MITITIHVFINIFKTEHFPAVKFAMGYEKNTREVIGITKIYSLICVGCMVREILTKGGIKFSTTSDLHEWYIKLFLSACTFQKYIFLSFLSFHFWNTTICLNSDHDWSGRSTQVQNGDYWLQEIDNPHNSVNRLNWFCLAYDYCHQIWI